MVTSPEGGAIVLVPYDPRWPSQFEDERTRILAAVGPHLVAVEHIGSTAVPGLAAKPILDILAGLRRLEDAEACFTPLAALGYEYVAEYEAEIPDRRYFRTGSPDARTHLHMVEFGGEFWKRHMLFRDHLRAHPAAAREYEALKRELAARFQDDREAYTNGKTAFIQAVETRARRA